jgi:Mg-chelatase subunit ChlD
VRPEEPVQERARVRIRAARLRIEPTALARSGECLRLGLDDLNVSLRGQRLNRSQLIDLEREREPTVHALLIDVSGSMVGKLERVRSAAREYVRQLRPDHERGMIVTFDESVILLEPPTSDRERLLAGIDRVSIGGQTSLIDGLYETVGALQAFGERPVVLLLTDGQDSASFQEHDEVHQRIERRADLTIFTIGFGVPAIRSGYAGPKPFLQRTARKTNGRYFDVPTPRGLAEVYSRIRELLDHEATLVVADPDPEPDAKPGDLRVSSRTDACKVRAFRESQTTPPGDDERIAPDRQLVMPARLPFPPSEELDELYEEWEHTLREPNCSRNDSPLDVATDLSSETRWFVDLHESRVEGCWLDITMETGLLYSTRTISRVAHNGWLGMQTRSFSFDVPGWQALPREPAELLDGMAGYALGLADFEPETDFRKRPDHKHARPYDDYEVVIQGRMLLEFRPRLGELLYQYPEYRGWLRKRLRTEAELEVDRLVERFRRYAPDETDGRLHELALQSESGRALLARAETPELRDLTHYLAGWLGDIPAHDLFVRWETIHLQRWLDSAESGAPDPSFVNRWRELRRIFFVPSYTRVLAPLALGYDAETDRVGFWRVILPRPGIMLKRTQGLEKHPDYADLPLDLVPDLPLAYWALLRGYEEQHVVARGLAGSGAHVRDVRYEILDPAWKQGPERAFLTTRVLVQLDHPGGSSEELVAEIVLQRKRREPSLSRLELRPLNDGPQATIATQH